MTEDSALNNSKHSLTDSNIKNDKTLSNCNNPIHCLHKNFKLPCSNMKLKYTTPKEIEKNDQITKMPNLLWI